MEQVESQDGTTIAFDQLGGGPPLVVVDGASTDRMNNTPIADALAHRFTVLNYDRRGRGDSSDTLPYTVAREVEDIQVLLDAAGGSAALLGLSSGAVLANSNSPMFLGEAAAHTAAAIPGCSHDVLAEQDHAVDADAIAKAVANFV